MLLRLLITLWTLKFRKLPEDKIKDMMKTKQCIETLMRQTKWIQVNLKKKSNKPNLFNNGSRVFVK